ncbi:MAG: hypothetical protein HYR96_11645 [Deltaproteobacteria bacterium]|nr:hypothetical protein [Deltaproteobacteria bacterium]MBI3294955.1 hypothetical protein [Deltaproteobacteria bacterium]
MKTLSVLFVFSLICFSPFSRAQNDNPIIDPLIDIQPGPPGGHGGGHTGGGHHGGGHVGGGHPGGGHPGGGHVGGGHSGHGHGSVGHHGGGLGHGPHYYPVQRRPWNYYRWHFNPHRYPWYWYGYARYQYYPGYYEGFYFNGYWRCIGYDDVAEGHEGGHAFRSLNYNAAFDAAFYSCAQSHAAQECVVSCYREQ